jgi:hypothetical protein
MSYLNRIGRERNTFLFWARPLVATSVEALPMKRLTRAIVEMTNVVSRASSDLCPFNAVNLT